MNFPELIGAHIKSDEIIEILEDFDLEVVYDFDRLHEGVVDAYHVSAYAQGFELLFDEHQNLQTVFLYIQPRDEIVTFPAEAMMVPRYGSIEEARIDFQSLNIEYIENQAPIPNQPGLHWIKGNLGSYTIHYQFRNDVLEMITFAAVAT